MSQVSRYPVTPNIQRRMKVSLQALITHLNRSEEVATFLSDFLTRTEKTVLAKRLMIALFLEKGFTYREISQLLKVSVSTVTKIQQLIDVGKGYKVGLNKLAEVEEWEGFWRGIRDVMHIIGKGRKVFG